MPFNDLLSRQTALILDGGLGSEIERRGVRLGGKLWSAGLLHSDPQLLFDIHAGFIEAGSDIITTASYQASIATIMEELGYGEQQARELIVSSVNIASSARDKWWEENKGKTSRLRPLVAFSCGSYGAFKADGSEFRGDYAADMTSEELVDFHRSRVELIIGNANADLLAFETIPCTKEAESICRLLESLPSAPPAWISFSCKDGSALNYNNESFQAAVSLVASSKANVIAVGVNCTAPQFVVPLLNKASLALKQLESPQAPLLIAYPNSGEEWDNEAKDWRDGLSLTPDEYAHMGLSYVEAGAKIIGGCCRVQPSHIGALRSRLLGPDPLVP